MDGVPAVLPSGQKVFPLRGLPAADRARLGVDALRPHHFPADPLSVASWPTFTKSALQRAMRELQWAALLRERDLRRAAAPAPAAAAPRKRRRGSWPPELGALPLVVVHCAPEFDALMTPTESCSLSAQLVGSYAAVRRHEGSVALLLAGLAPPRLEALGRVTGVAAWRAFATPLPLGGVFRFGGGGGGGGGGDGGGGVRGCGVGEPPPPALAATPAASITYLTADADAVLWAPRPGCVYVVGGIVDRNRHKGLCAEVAAAAGLATARLPLQEVVAAGLLPGGLKRLVLTTNKVVGVLAAVAAGAGTSRRGAGGDNAAAEQLWADALKSVLEEG